MLHDTLGLSPFVKENLLKNHWMPQKGFVYPHTIFSKQNKFLRHNHLSENYSCFKYSPSAEGIFCIPCTLFATLDSSSNKKQSSLVTKPLCRYDKLTGKDGYLTVHISREYHKLSCEKAACFLKSVNDPESSDVRNLLDSKRKMQVEENRSRLKPIIDTIILCGRQGLALRGHRDDGVLVPDERAVCCSGNFRALLEYRVNAGDSVLKKHLETAGNNATYISKTTQNEIIDIIGNLIQQKVLEKVKKAKIFAVLADETTDCSGREQLSLCLRFTENNMIREEFLQFLTVEDITGRGLGDTILELLKSYDLSPEENLVGQGYDGAAAMSGCIKGAQTIIRETCKYAAYVHCSSHCLNLCLNESAKVVQIRNMFTKVSACTNFINSSAKRRAIFQSKQAKNINSMQKKTLKTLCATRFIERHDSIIVFTESLEEIAETLDDIVDWKDKETSEIARRILVAISNSSFLVALSAAFKVMSLTIMLSKSVEKINQDLVAAMEQCKYTIDRLQSWRQDDDAFIVSEN